MVLKGSLLITTLIKANIGVHGVYRFGRRDTGSRPEEGNVRHSSYMYEDEDDDNDADGVGDDDDDGRWKRIAIIPWLDLDAVVSQLSFLFNWIPTTILLEYKALSYLSVFVLTS